MFCVSQCSGVWNIMLYWTVVTAHNCITHTHIYIYIYIYICHPFTFQLVALRVTVCWRMGVVVCVPRVVIILAGRHHVPPAGIWRQHRAQGRHLERNAHWVRHNGTHLTLGLDIRYSLSGKTSYRKIWWSLEAARFGFRLFESLWNLTGTSAATLPRCLSNFKTDTIDITPNLAASILHEIWR